MEAQIWMRRWLRVGTFRDFPTTLVWCVSLVAHRFHLFIAQLSGLDIPVAHSHVLGQGTHQQTDTRGIRQQVDMWSGVRMRLLHKSLAADCLCQGGDSIKMTQTATKIRGPKPLSKKETMNVPRWVPSRVDDKVRTPMSSFRPFLPVPSGRWNMSEPVGTITWGANDGGVSTGHFIRNHDSYTG